MYKYVQRRLKDIVERTYSILDVKGTWNGNKNLKAENGCTHRGENNLVVRPAYCTSELINLPTTNAEVNQFSASDPISSRREECHKEKGRANDYPYSFLSALTWSSALICGYYASQLLCLNRRHVGWDSRCAYTKFLLTPNRALHTSVLARLAFICPFPRHEPLYESPKRSYTNLKCVRPTHKKSIGGDSGIFIGDTARKSTEPYSPPDIFEDPIIIDLHGYKLHNVNNDDDQQKLNKNNNNKNDEDSISSVEDAVEDLLSVISDIEFNLGIKAINTKEYETAVSHFKLAAGHHHASATFNLGLCFEQGLGVKQSYRHAMECYQAAADLKHPRAIYNLGIYYAKGLGGLKKSTKAARKCFITAAQLGLTEAKLALGIPVPNTDILKPNERVFESAIYKSVNTVLVN